MDIKREGKSACAILFCDFLRHNRELCTVYVQPLSSTPRRDKTSSFNLSCSHNSQTIKVLLLLPLHSLSHREKAFFYYSPFMSLPLNAFIICLQLNFVFFCTLCVETTCDSMCVVLTHSIFFAPACK